MSRITNNASKQKKSVSTMGLRQAFVMIMALLAACSSDGRKDTSSGGQGTKPGYSPQQCIVDEDGDGYGIGCPLGPDCDDTDPNITDECYTCLPPHEGCPCDQEGKTISCGEVAVQVGNTVSCIVGERTCKEGAWGPCVGSFSGTKNLKPMDLGSNTTCINNPCDPGCQYFPDEPSPDLPGLEGPISADEDGVSLDPGAVTGGPSESCVNESVTADPIPLDIVMMVDTSGSMAGTYWTNVKKALNSFIESSDSLGVGFGIQQFPSPNVANTCTTIAPCSIACDIDQYSTLLVNDMILPLDNHEQNGHAKNVLNTIATWEMKGGTPTSAALQGAIQRAYNHALIHSDHKVVVVLATDGDPTYCPGGDGGDKQSAAQMEEMLTAAVTAAQTGFNNSPSIPTYVIGVGGKVTANNLHRIARAGQGITNASEKPAYMVDGGNSGAFLSAMNDIRAKALPCEFSVPMPTQGVIDPLTTSLTFTPGNSTDPQSWDRTDTCVDGQNGWYYDDPNEPTRIILCPTSCTVVKADANATLGFDYSCINDCSPRVAKAEPEPLNMLIMLDRSGSMGFKVSGYSGNTTRWAIVKNALKSFVADPKSEGIKVGLSYFAQFTGTVCTDSQISCNSNHYQNLAIGFDTLVSPNAGAISTSLDNTKVCSGTPTKPALIGAATRARQEQANTGEKTVVVLATDGLPESCVSSSCEYTPGNRDACLAQCPACSYSYWFDTVSCNPSSEKQSCFDPCYYASYYECTSDEVATEAQTFLNGSPSIKTYVIGAGATPQMASYLDNIAAKGGTGAALIANDSDPQSFVTAMNAIRAAEISCDYQVPNPAAGKLDPKATKVHYTPTTGSKETWGKVTDASECPDTGNGWYYDDNIEPTKVVVCPESCERARLDTGSKIEFEYACVGEHSQGSFTRQYDMAGQCPPSAAPVWGVWTWEAEIPDDSSIDFEVSVLKPDGTYSDFVPLVFVKPFEPVPTWWSDELSGTAVGATTETQKALTVVDVALGLNSLPRQSWSVRIRSILNPSSNKLTSPVLKKWDIQVSCQQVE